MIIAIDGPAAAGKGTLGRRLAERFGLAHLDTGTLYRATAARVLKNGGDPSDAGAARAAAESLDPADLAAPELRDQAVGVAASVVAAHQDVRAALVEYQRRFARRPPGAVLDGRDIGTVILPDADIKIFVTASAEARAGRRHKELREQGVKSIRSAVLRELAERDERDRARAVAPLAAAPDAFLLDTTNLDADAAFAAAVDFVLAHLPDGTKPDS
jgi:cytidylate kinase